ncbi:hypothetical protein OG470_22830 [Micromonospora sp. NBC_00389]|uniref:ATP-dependent DNA ligase n=1 Tax=Micromonospora sp. NBC_00389 TaxID=2903586 RepID=UPI002E1A9E10
MSWVGPAVTRARRRVGTTDGLRPPLTPRLAKAVDTVREASDLAYEPKWDGWRALAFRRPDTVYLQSRAGRDITTYFPNPRKLHRMGSFPRELLALEPTCDRLRPRSEGQ